MADVCEKYKALFDDTVMTVVEPSGRCSGKTTSNEIAAISYMLRSKYNNIWYCRAEKTDIRDTVYASMWSTIQAFGLEHEFTNSLSPIEIRCKSGAVCYFGGINGKTADDLTATKGFTPANKTLALCILDEADEVKCETHIEAWEKTANRWLLPFGKIVFAYNPPMQKAHWAHAFFKKKIDNGAARCYATWEDIKEALNPRTIYDIEAYKRNEPDLYRYWYLGEPVAFKGLVYPQFDRKRHETNIYALMSRGDKPMELIFGVDEGSIFDSTCVTPLCVMFSGVAVVMGCWENDPVKTGAQAPSKQARDIIDYLNRFFLRFTFLQYVPRRWIFESAEAGQNLMNQFIFETNGTEDCQPVRQKSVMGDIKRVRSMLQERALLFHKDGVFDVDDCEKIESDIENYVFDTRTNAIKKGQRDDTIDSLEYATKALYDIPIRGEEY